MKKILIAVLLLSASATALADRGYYRNYNYHRGPNYNWVAPAIVGGAIVGGLVYGATRPYYAPNLYAPPVYVPPPPVIVNPPPVYVAPPAPTLYWDYLCQCYR